MAEPKSPQTSKKRKPRTEKTNGGGPSKKAKKEEIREERKREPVVLIVERLTKKGRDALAALQLADATEKTDNDLVHQFFAGGYTENLR